MLLLHNTNDKDTPKAYARAVHFCVCVCVSFSRVIVATVFVIAELREAYFRHKHRNKTAVGCV